MTDFVLYEGEVRIGTENKIGPPSLEIPVKLKI